MQAICGLSDAERAERLNRIDTLGKPGTLSMVKAAQAFVIAPAGILTLYGGPGNAKTAVMMAIVNELVSLGIEAVYTTFVDLEGWVREAFDEKRHDEFGSARSRIQHLAAVRVLAMDEFDKAKITDWLSELRFDLLDKRYRTGICGESGTLLAMNCDPRTLPDWIASRLFDGRNRIVHNPDPDIRPLMR